MVYFWRIGIIFLLFQCFFAVGCATKQPDKEDIMDHHDLFQSLEGVTVKNPDGESIALASLWQDRQVVLVFLRHFG